MNSADASNILKRVADDHPSIRLALKEVIAHLEDIDAVKLTGNESLITFGGESNLDGFNFAEYGISFEAVAVHGITRAQAKLLACTLVDHLIRNGHAFELCPSGIQDNWTRLRPL